MISQLNKNENNESEIQNHQPKQSSANFLWELLVNILSTGDSLFYFFEIFGGLFKFIIEVSVAIIVAISSIF